MSLKPLEVKTENIAPKAVTNGKLGDKSVTSIKIEDGAVTPEKLSMPVVSRPLTPGLNSAEIKDAAVTSIKIAPNAVTSDHIAADAVATDDIKDGAITTEKIRDGSVTKEKMADGTIGTAEIVDGSITAAKLATNSVTQSKISANAVGSSELQANSVRTSEIANGAVTAEKLAPGVGGGDTMTFLPTSVEALYLTDITADIPYTSFDLSAYVPEGAKGVLIQIGIFNQAYASGRAFFRVRTNEEQRDALGVGVIPGQNSMSANQGIAPLTSARSIEYALESVGGPWSATLTLYITVIGYIM